MAAHSAQMRERILAFLKSAPIGFSVKLAEAAGVFAPIAPLFDDLGDASDARVDGVARASVTPIWRWLSQDLAQDQALEAVAVWTAEMVSRPGREAQALVDKLHTEGGAAMLLALASQAPKACQGDARLRRDMETAAALFAVAPQVAKLVAKWPKSIPNAQRHVDGIAAFVAKRGEKAPELGPALLSLLLRRCENPTQILAAIDKIAPQVAERDLWRFDRLIEAVLALAPPAYALDSDQPLDADAALKALDGEAEWLDLADQATRNAKRPAWRSRIEDVRRETGRRYEAACTRIGAQVREAAPSGGVSPIGPPAEALKLEIEQGGRFIRGAAISARRLRFEAAREFAASEIENRLNAQSIAAALEAARSPSAKTRAKAGARLDMLVHLASGYQGEEAGAALAARVADARASSLFQAWFFEPAEPMIVTAAGQKASTVDRSLFDKLWTLLCESEHAEAAADAVAASDRAVTEEGEPAARKLAQAQRRVLAPLLRSLVSSSELRDIETLERLVGGPKRRAAAGHVAVALEHTEVVYGALASWEQGLRQLDEDRVDALREAYESATAIAPEVGPVLLMVGARRLAKPAQILRVVGRIARSTNEFMVENTDLSIIGELLIDEAEAVARQFAAPKRARFDDAAMVAAVSRYADIVYGMTEEFQLSKDGAWGGRLFALKSAASVSLQSLCERVVDAVEAATPRRVDPKSKRWAPGGQVSDDEAADAAAYIRFLRNTAVIDERAAFASARRAALNEVTKRVETYCDALVGSVEADDQEKAALLSVLSMVVSALSGEEAAAVMRRRSAAAA